VYGATAGCIEDWTSTTTGGMGFCTEVRDTGTYGFVMPTSEIIPNARENWASAESMMEQLLAASTITLSTGPGTTMNADTVTPVKVGVTANVGSLLTSAAVRLKWQVNGGAVQTANMALASGLWGANLPATACGNTLTWWVEAETNFTVTRWPANTPVSVRTTSTGTCAVQGDLDGDGIVGAGDLSILLLDYGPCPGCPSDLDGNGVVDGGDISFLLLLYT
jgi:hypothetical protein